MAKRRAEILLVENDADLAEMIGQHLEGAARAHVTAVGSAAEALREELTAQHDLLLVELSLPDGNGLRLMHELRLGNDGPVILMADDPTVDDALEAIHLGAAGLLRKPLEISHLSQVVQQALKRDMKRRAEVARSRRLRRLTSRILHERRDLRQRMDLICRDVVQAYRQLALKMAEMPLPAHECRE